MSEGWIGVDLDGTLAHYDHWRGPDHIGQPIPVMLDRVRSWLRDGMEVRIFTARVSDPTRGPECEQAIRDWCVAHLGVELQVTCRKDYDMIELWDDRCIRVERNTGRVVG